MIYTNKVQVALFFSNPPDKTGMIFYKLNDKLNDFFDNQPVILPIPDDAPKDIPSVQASTKDGHYTLATQILNRR